MTTGSALLQMGPLASPPGILVTLLVIAAVLLIGRFALNLAWKLVVVAIVIVATLWLLGVLGFGFGLFGVAGPPGV